MRVKLYITLFWLAVIMAGPGQARAAAPGNASNITIRPFLQELKINPGEPAKQFELAIINDSKFKQVFHLSAVDFGALNESGGLAFEGANVKQLNSKYGLKNWIRLDKNDVDLDAGSQASIGVTIINDANLSPGAHYAAIIISAAWLPAQSGQLTVTPKVSSLVFATKIGGEKYDIHLQSFSHNGDLLTLPSSANVRFKSTGNTYIVPRGVVTINQNGRQISKGIINETSAIVLPETIRNFYVPLRGVNKISSGFIFTDYKIQVDYRYDGASQFATHSFSYRIFNVKLLAIGITFILLLAATAVTVRFNSPAAKTTQRHKSKSNKKL